MEIQQFLQFLHFTDNTTNVPYGEQGYDRLARVRPIITAVRDTFLVNYHHNNAIDEAMIKFKGRSAMKQYVPLKPIKCGFKVWERCPYKSCSVLELGAIDANRARGTCVDKIPVAVLYHAHAQWSVKS